MNIINLIKKIFKNNNKQNEIDEELEQEELEKIEELRFFKEEQKAERKALKQRIRERQKHYKIRFCFIPEVQNSLNIRSYLEYKTKNYLKWNEIRMSEFKKRNNTCMCCNQPFDNSVTERKPELHEEWTFNDKTRVQAARKLYSLCAECHQIAHINRHKNDKKMFDYLFKKYIEYNNIEEYEAKEDLDFAFKEKERRKGMKYILNMTVCAQYLNDIHYFADYEEFDCHNHFFQKFIKNEFTNPNRDKDNKENKDKEKESKTTEE